jgi:2-keto-4-pentenoate hydratase/2-oxohepta-3-ene-1,7-dioic acid hydratase in catechol pathway
VRLVTYRARGENRDRVGVLDSDVVAEVLGAGSMLELLRRGLDGVRTGEGTPLSEVRLRAPLPRPNSMRDFMLVEEHVRNSLGDVPAEWYEIPVYWKGNCDAVFGPEDEVPWPAYTEKLDYELEVGAVIGRRVSRVSVEEAADCIAGYTIFNDWSARDIQFREMKVGLGPGLGKDFATSLGPCLTTADAIDIRTAPMRARINGEVWSEGTLGAMRFSFRRSSRTSPRSRRSTRGTSSAAARSARLRTGARRWIRPGDVVELEVEGIGALRNRVGAPAAARQSQIGAV